MADNAEAVGEDQITFRVKSSTDGTHTVTMADSATVLELKQKLSSEEYENLPVERQRLIYSGRVMKNDETLAFYKVKPNNTIHLVKSAASNSTQLVSTSESTPPVPTNMASGTANNPLAGLIGARYAGHQINLPGMDMFGPDGGMGPPMDEERLQRMMSDPNVQQAMNEAFNNPEFIIMLVESNPMLRNLPGARELITSPDIRQMMTNPDMMRHAMRMQRLMNGGGADSSFPAPGITDTSPQSPATGGDNANPANHFQQGAAMNSLMLPGLLGNAGAGDHSANIRRMVQILQGNRADSIQTEGTEQTAQGAQEASAATGDLAQPASDGTTTNSNTSAQQPANPFAALFPQQANLFSMSPEMMQQMLQMIGGGAASNAPPDNCPPEERYAEQLRQLNNMGFFDFDRNIAALRRSGGSVQGAIEHLLGAADF